MKISKRTRIEARIDQLVCHLLLRAVVSTGGPMDPILARRDFGRYTQRFEI